FLLNNICPPSSTKIFSLDIVGNAKYTESAMQKVEPTSFAWEEKEIPVELDRGKRAFDILFSLGVLVFGFPFFFLIGLCIFVASPGPIFYKSERLGRGRKIIYCLKFRTMCVDADKKLLTLLLTYPHLENEWKKYQKLKMDPRITWIGKFLRKTSLDELPQFWNVLKGDLSVVGPRPFVLVGPKELFTKEIRKYLGDKTEKILSVRPGITGLWQVSGRSQLSIKERIEIEESYIDNRSFSKDFFIILKTFSVILFRKGAY
ncbi:MAG: sugar transferase, partial [Chlamydiota bacterium]